MNNIAALLSYIIPGYLDRALKGGVGDIVLNAGPMVQFVFNDFTVLFYSVLGYNLFKIKIVTPSRSRI